MALDAVWLGAVAKTLYRRELGHLMSDKPFWPAAGVFYALYAAGIVYFASSPADSARRAAVNGALLGLLAYGTYDLTNMAILRDWGLRISAIDVAWGVVLTSAASAAAYAARGA